MDLHRIKGPTFCQPVQQPDGIAALIRIISQIMIQIQSLYFDSIVLRLLNQLFASFTDFAPSYP